MTSNEVDTEQGKVRAVRPAELMIVSVPAARDLVTELVDDVPGFAQDMLEYVSERLQAVREHDEVRALTLATCAAHIEALLSMMRLGIPAERTETPVVALEHARRIAALGLGIDDMLRIYRLGQAQFWERLSAALIDRIEDHAELGAALQQTAAVTFGYSDVVSTRVSIEHLTELQRRQRQAIARRADIVRSVMSGETVERTVAERTLGHRLDGKQLAFVCWVNDEGGGMEAAALAVARSFGAERALLLPEGPGRLAAWIRVPETGAVEPQPADIGAAISEFAPRVRVAVGAVGAGIDGFRSSRTQADRAERISRLTGSSGTSVTFWTEVVLVDLLSRDLDAARDLVRLELGALARRGESAERLREAMLAYIAAQGSHLAASAALGVHRNTALHRLHRAEELRGRPVTERQAEVHAALRLCAVLGDSVMPD